MKVGQLYFAVVIDDALLPRVGAQMSDVAKFIRSLPAGASVLVAYAHDGVVDIVEGDRDRAIAALRMPKGQGGAFSSIYLSLQDLISRRNPAASNREILVVSDGVDRLRGGRNVLGLDAHN